MNNQIRYTLLKRLFFCPNRELATPRREQPIASCLYCLLGQSAHASVLRSAAAPSIERASSPHTAPLTRRCLDRTPQGRGKRTAPVESGSIDDILWVRRRNTGGGVGGSASLRTSSQQSGRREGWRFCRCTHICFARKVTSLSQEKSHLCTVGDEGDTAWLCTSIWGRTSSGAYRISRMTSNFFQSCHTFNYLEMFTGLCFEKLYALKDALFIMYFADSLTLWCYHCEMNEYSILYLVTLTIQLLYLWREKVPHISSSVQYSHFK